MKTVNDVVNQFGSTYYKLYDGDDFMLMYYPTDTAHLLDDWGQHPVIEVGCMKGVHIHLLNLQKMSVRQCRMYLNLTQEDVHQIIGVPIRTLQNWEAGSRECPEYVRKLVVAELLRHSDI